MASREEASEPLQCKKLLLRVSIHCEGCKKKVKRILQHVPGVYTTEIDSQQNKVTVTGDVEAETLIRKLLKSGKHAELWPTENKPNNPTTNPNPSGKEKSKEKGKEAEKEKDASKSNEPTEKPEKKPEKSAAATKSETDTKPSETATAEKPATVVTKPAESDTKSGAEIAESSSKEASAAPKPEKAASSSEIKPADTASRSTDSGKKKNKNKGVEAAGKNEEVFAMNSGGNPPVHHQPAYPQPLYAASYNMAHPSASYSYYAPTPPMPQSYMYSGHPPPPPQQSYMYSGHPPPEYYPHYPQENYYPHESYHGSMEPAPSSSSHSQGSYDFFSDENANSCNVM